MNSPTDLLLLAVGAILPSVFAGLVFFHRQRKYANWAKVASIIAAIGGFIWGGIQWAYCTLLIAIAFHLRVVFGEEPWLSQRHGASWQIYKRQVPRWVGARRNEV